MSHQNFRIVIAFVVFFTILLLIFTEFNTSLAGAISVIGFKHGSDDSTVQGATFCGLHLDEEKTKVPSSTNSESEVRREKKDMRETFEQQPRMRNTFTWQEINYEVAGRRLLDDVAGYVAPGKLTALMGGSGSGKVCALIGNFMQFVGVDCFLSKTTLLDVLVERTETGIISGTRLVNGHSLPSDFQPQT